MLAPSFLALIFLGLFLSFLLARWISSTIAEPILILAKGARTVIQFGRVDLKVAQSLHELPAYKSLDEVGQLLRDESSMLKTLHSLQNNLEEQVRQRSAMLNTIFELSPDGYLEITQDGNIGFFNPTFLSMLGFGNLDLSNFAWPSLRDLLNESLAEGEYQFDDNFFVQRILRFNTPSLRTLMVSMRVTNTGAMFLYWRDLTSEVEMEEMKKAFFAKIAHELRTPLTSILGFSQLLYLSSDIDDKHKESLEIILRQGNNLLNLINNLLDIARLESKKTKHPRESSYSLSALTRLVLDDFKMPEDTRDISLFLDDHLPDIYFDRQHFRQVLVNLLSNAYKYSPIGSPIEVRTCEALKSGTLWVGLQIKDFGVGMDAIELSQLGTPFYRVNPDGAVPGTGLGISVVREIMALHGGTIEFISNHHVGTIATIWFPVKSKLN
jgi:signal transduction histidine kinase